MVADCICEWPLCLSVGWATGVPWSSALASGSSATAAEEPTATPTCSSASEGAEDAPWLVFFPHTHSCRSDLSRLRGVGKLWGTFTSPVSPFQSWTHCFCSLPESEHGFCLPESIAVACKRSINTFVNTSFFVIVIYSTVTTTWCKFCSCKITWINPCVNMCFKLFTGLFVVILFLKGKRLLIPTGKKITSYFQKPTVCQAEQEHHVAVSTKTFVYFHVPSKIFHFLKMQWCIQVPCYELIKDKKAQTLKSSHFTHLILTLSLSILIPDLWITHLRDSKI